MIRSWEFIPGGDGWEFWYKTIDDVMQGRAAGYIGSNGDQGDLDFDKLAAHIQPGFGDHAPSPVADPITCAILSKASDEQKEAGFKWISYLTSVQGTAKFAMNTGYTPVRTAALEDEAFQAYLEENPQARGSVGTAGICTEKLLRSNKWKNRSGSERCGRYGRD